MKSLLQMTTVAQHRHGNLEHSHAHAYIPHSHLLRAVCLREECRGCATHNIHPGPIEPLKET